MKQLLHFLVYFFFITGLAAQDDAYLNIEAADGDGMIHLLKPFDLLDTCSIQQFKEHNNFKTSDGLVKGLEYKIPVLLFPYNGTSVGASIGVKEPETVQFIEQYNLHLLKKGVVDKGYKAGDYLYVPYSALYCPSYFSQVLSITKEEKEPEHIQVHPIFGEESKEVTIESDQLKGKVFYLVSGHGGPDPGAIGKYEGAPMCEDEYAYDITLRLAKNLMKHQATVHILIKDLNDGIRDEAILPCDYEEQSINGLKIPRNQVMRLKQRADDVNRLYYKHKKDGVTSQQLLVLHVDSRAVEQRIDMFFYHNKKSKSGKALAEHLHQTINKKYGVHQKNRGYDGNVQTRNLYMLKKTLPTTVYMELGNIRNEKDQRRFVLESNRQAIANWLLEGIKTFKP